MQTIDKIKVDEIIDRLLENNDLTASPGVWYGLHQIKNLPVMEIVTEIVTCGECKHRDPEDKKCDCGHAIIWQLPRDDNWYCADAERRTDGQGTGD